MKSLESIIEGGLYSLEDDTIDIPQEEVTSDEYNEVILDGINENATVEQFLIWSRNAQEHLRVLASISTESNKYRSLEADTLKKIGQGVKDVIRTLITNFINFIKKTINYFRSIGIKKKCEFIGKKQQLITKELIEKYGKDKKFINPDTILGVKNLCNNNFAKTIFTPINYSIAMTSNNNVIEMSEKYSKELKNSDINAVDMVNIYRRGELWKAESFFTKDYQSLLGKFNTLSGKLGAYFADRKDSEQSEGEIQKTKQIQTMYNLCVNATGKWITMTAFMYKLCKNAEAGKEGSKEESNYNTSQPSDNSKSKVVDRSTDEWSKDNDGIQYEVLGESFYSLMK